MANVYSGVITPVFNEIVGEYREVLSRDKFHLNPKDVDQALKTITSYGLNLDRT